MGSVFSSSGRAEIALRGIDDGNDPLFVAIRRNDTVTAIALIEKEVVFAKANPDEPNLLTELDRHNCGPLHFALTRLNLNIEIVKALLKAMIDIGVDLNHRGGSEQNTVLLLLLKNNLEESAIELISGMAVRENSLNVSDAFGNTPLHIAGLKSQERAMRALIEAGAAINALCMGFTPLHCSACTGKIKSVKVLVEAKADLDLQATDGQTALHMAIRNFHAGIVSVLLVAGAKIDLPDHVRHTAISLAEQSTNKNIRNMLTAIYSFKELEYQQAIDAAILPGNNGYYDFLWEMAERVYMQAMILNNKQLSARVLRAYKNISPDDTLHYVAANSRIAHIHFDEFIALESEAEAKQDADFIMSDATKQLLKKILHYALLARPGTQGIIDQVCRRLSGLGSRENYFNSEIHNLDGAEESLMNLCEEISTLRDHLSHRKELSELYEKIAQLQAENNNLRMLNSEKFKTGLATSLRNTLFNSDECRAKDDADTAQHPFKI